MRRLLYISLLLFAHSFTGAQVVEPLGYGISDNPLLITQHLNGIAVAAADDNDRVHLHIWNGYFWQELDMPDLPQLGDNSYGHLELKDLKSISGDLYILAEHTLDLVQNAPNYVLRWTGSEWDDISDGQLNQALELHRMIQRNDQLQIVGIYSGDTAHYNIAELDGATWEFQGNLITKNVNNDYFSSVYNTPARTYVTGSFTDPSIGETVSFVEWDGSVWQNASFPPFLQENRTIGSYNGSLVVYGTNSFNSELVKMKSGTSWLDISDGLEQFNISEIRQFASANGKLYAIGDIQNSSNEAVDLLVYNDDQWSEVQLNMGAPAALAQLNGKLFVGGDFEDGKRLNHFGRLSNHAMAVATVFHDENGNCVLDAGEELIRNYPLELDGEHMNLNTDRNGMLYLPLTTGPHALNAGSVKYWNPTCPDYDLQANEKKVYDGVTLGVKPEYGRADAAVWLTDNQGYVHQQGEQKRAMICAYNRGTQTLTDVSLRFEHGDEISNLVSERLYDSYSNGVAEWTVDLEVEEELCFYLDYTTTVDDVIELNASITTATAQPDQDLTDNQSTVRYKTGSVDDNHKSCSNGPYISEDEESMSYKIGFKNSGIDTALDLIIIDVLDEDIIPSSQGVYYYYSHDCELLPTQYEILDDGKWQYTFGWKFEDINLSNEDDESAEGFLEFKVYLYQDYLKRGDVICNDAELYYSYRKGSYNEPMVTNEVCSQVGGSTGIEPITESPFSIKPIPAHNKLEINNKTSEFLDLELVNYLGEQVLSAQVQPYGDHIVDISDLASGIYFLSNGNTALKVVVH